MRTPLGRDVPVGDWDAYREDQVLKLLSDFQMNPFNDGTLRLGLASISNSTGLDPAGAQAVTERLVAKGYAERFGYDYAITPRGLIFVGLVGRNPLTGSL